MASPSVFSSHWYRISELNPSLKSHVSVVRHVYRDEVWYILQDGASVKQHRLNEFSYAVVGRMTGKQSVQNIWEQVVDVYGDLAPSQPYVIALVGKLHQAELIRTEVTPNVAELFRSRDERSKKELKGKLNPFAFRVGLFDPDSLLEASSRYAQFFFKSWAVLLWVIVTIVALTQVASSWSEIKIYGSAHLLSPRMLLVMWFVYPLLKALHEFSHGLALKVWGGHSHDFGITLMLLMPVPYIDCSSAATFVDKHRRIAVSLIGIAVEVLVACLALFVWIYAADGLVREIAFALMFIGGFSTVLFNANPLMKFDGYHALADWVEIPSLAQRSQQYLDYKIKTVLMGGKEVQEPSHSAHERSWLTGYGIAAYVYKFIISFGIIQWLLGVSVVLAVAVASWFVLALLLLPLGKLAWYAWRSPEVRRSRMRALACASGLVFLVAFGLFGLQIPHVTSAQGVVWLPDDARVRAQNEGFIARVLVRDGAVVKRGDVLMELEDPNLDAEQLKLAARLTGLQANHFSAMVKSPAQGALIAEDMARTEAEIARLDQRRGELQVVARSNGKLILPQADNLVGKFALRGTMLAHVVPNNEWQVRVVLPQQDVDFDSFRGLSLQDVFKSIFRRERILCLFWTTNQLKFWNQPPICNENVILGTRKSLQSEVLKIVLPINKPTSTRSTPNWSEGVKSVKLS